MKRRHYVAQLAAQKVSNLFEWAVTPLIYRPRKPHMKIEKSQRYGDTRCSVCDLIYPEKCKDLPIMLYIHGGGFISGRKNTRRFYCYKYVQNGYFVYNMHYDCMPQSTPKQQIKQVFQVLKQIRENQKQYGYSLDNLFVGGESAGAYLAALAANAHNRPELFRMLQQEELEPEKVKIKGLVLIHGLYSLHGFGAVKLPFMKSMMCACTGFEPKEVWSEKRYAEIQAMDALIGMDSRFPPTVVGRGDKDVLDKESLYLIKKLEENNIPHQEYIAKGLCGNHGFVLAADLKESKRCFDETIRFFASCRNDY